MHKTLKGTAIRPACPDSMEEARKVVGDFVEYYNSVRLHSAIGYITPDDKMAGRETEIWQERDRKLETAREMRKVKRQLYRQKQKESA